MQVRGLRFWGLISAALHVLALVIGLVFGLPRPIAEPEEQAIAVEIVAALPNQQAQGDRPAPVAAPAAVPQPARPEPPAPEPVREQIPTPPPPPPPPPPAPAPPPQPQAQAAPPKPSPPTPTPAEPLPTPPLPTPPPPRPPLQQAQVAPLPPAPQPPPRPAPHPPTPATPTPPAPPAPPRPQAQPTPPAPPRPEPTRPSPVPPPPTPSQTAGTGQTPPVQRPQERSNSVLSTLDRLRQQQASNEPPRGPPRPAPGAPQQGGGTPTGTANLSSSEKAGLADKISECWSVDGGGVGIQNVIVEFRVEVDAGGTVRNVRPNGSVPTEPRARAVYEAARRALLDPKCNPLPLPRERLAALRDTVFRFNPRDLGLR